MTSRDEALHEDEVSEIAHRIYEGSGRINGRDLNNWLEAEQIVLARCRGAVTPAHEDAEFSGMPFEGSEY